MDEWKCGYAWYSSKQSCIEWIKYRRTPCIGISIPSEEIWMGDAEHMDAAQEAVDYMVDECDADIDDAEELTI